ncbi:hypothetical protein LCGC14_1173290 [marine sediment metagenome]|uniref:PilZ domain-containing protein n=1 Tax=marine sediment metagenome TaxID=412755 RepID=A0A0F9LPD7_9ZZZZ
MKRPKNDSTNRAFTVRNGESYELRVVDFGAGGLKIELFDPRELDLLDSDRIHAVLITPRNTRDLLQWMCINMI